ncbi:hypothetical protein GHT06_019223 [Daphnia sinensis]|uniref:Uncharacterized protein n=1 Tax=Daphnia sinensis TaxID=1820382 RepID=A0AAD5PP34_9CRUS|nr:hypothetical protein GHT06_019223 [Daphnia sinensis]
MGRLKCNTITHSSTLFAVASHLQSSLKMKFLAVLVALFAVFACVMAQGYNNNYGGSPYPAPSAPAPVYSGNPAPNPYAPVAPSPYGGQPQPAPAAGGWY